MRKWRIYLALIVLSMATLTHAQTDYKTVLKDFQTISGNWTGSLTYLDYSTGKPYTMPADIELKQIGKTNQFAVFNSYPNEKSANSTDTLVLSTDGQFIDRAIIRSRKKLSNGDTEIVTEETGTDGNDNRPATFKHTYTFGKSAFTNRKDVQFEGESEWIKRHEYRYTRKSGK